jgi:CopG antitoxin of type II toxin-antitoxin system
MPKNNMTSKPIHKPFNSITELAEFWDTHSPADYDDLSRPDIHLELDVKTRHRWVAIDPALSDQLSKVAHAQGISTETLINLWLSRQIKQA